jgi:hypothetical protein
MRIAMGVCQLRADFKTSAKSPQPLADPNTSQDAPHVLASCLALLVRKWPDLALVAERWESLPQALRAGIVAMVKVGDMP